MDCVPPAIRTISGFRLYLAKSLNSENVHKRSLKTGDAAVCNDDVFVGPCRIPQQNKDNGNDSKNAAEKSIPHGGLAPVKTLNVIFIITRIVKIVCVFANLPNSHGV